MMLIRIIIMLLIALFVESRQEAFGQTTDTLSLSDKVIRTALHLRLDFVARYGRIRHFIITILRIHGQGWT